jgi:hypothetical protein
MQNFSLKQANGKKFIVKVTIFLSSRYGRALLLALVAASISLQLVMQQRVGLTNAPGYTSDDVAQQTILSQWVRGYGGNAMIGDDNWFIKYPLYLVVDATPLQPEAKALTTALILTLTTLLGIIVVLWLITSLTGVVGRVSLTSILLPVMAVGAFSPALLYIISRNNTRNIEVLLFTALIGLLVVYNVRKLRRPLLIAIVSAVLIGVLLADDPMFRFMGAIVAVVAIVVRSGLPGVSLRHLANIGLVIVGGVVAAVIITHVLFVLLPISYVVRPQGFTSLHGFLKHLDVLFSQDLILFNADFWGKPIGLSTAINLLNGALVLVGVVSAKRMIQQSMQDSKGGTSTLLIGILPFWIIGVVMIASFNADIRYLLLVPFAFVLAIVVAVSKGLFTARLAILITIGFGICALYNTAKAGQILLSHRDNAANVEEQSVARVLSERHLTKGMATYWHANITSYVSDFSTDVIGISCDNNAKQITYNPILSASGLFKKRADNSYVLFGSAKETGEAECTLETITAKFGSPDEVVAVPNASGSQIAVYDRDVTNTLISGAKPDEN